MSPQVPQNTRSFFTSWEPVSSSRTVLHAVIFVSPDQPPSNQPHCLPAASLFQPTRHFYKVTLSTALSCIFLPWWSEDSSGHTETQTWNTTTMFQWQATDISLVPQSSKYRVNGYDSRGFNNLLYTIPHSPDATPRDFFSVGLHHGSGLCSSSSRQVSRNWRYESEPPFKPSPLTRYRQFGISSIIVLMFVGSQRVHI